MKRDTMSRAEFGRVTAGLKRNGWEHTLSVMDDCGTGGLRYEKGGRVFWWRTETNDDARLMAAGFDVDGVSEAGRTFGRLLPDGRYVMAGSCDGWGYDVYASVDDMENGRGPGTVGGFAGVVEMIDAMRTAGLIG